MRFQLSELKNTANVEQLMRELSDSLERENDIQVRRSVYTIIYIISYKNTFIHEQIEYTEQIDRMSILVHEYSLYMYVTDGFY